MENNSIIILGAGITGLVTAWFLQQKGHSVLLLEKSNRSGGWIKTIEKDGFLFEQGPRSCRPKGHGVATLQLVEALGLQEQVIIGNAAAKKRYLWTDGALQQFPTSLWGFFRSPLTRDLPLKMLREWWLPKGTVDDESIYAFISRRFNPEIAERLADPMVAGIYAGDIKKLSMRSCFPRQWEWEKQHGSLVCGAFSRKSPLEESSFVMRMQKESLFTFRDGMETLPRALAEALGGSLRLGTEVVELREKDKGIEVVLNGGETLFAEHVVSTLPAYALAKIVDPNLGVLLKEISYASITNINLGYDGPLLDREGFGYLIPSREKEEILGVVWDSSAFPEQNRSPDQTRLTVFTRQQKPLEIALEAIERHLGIKEEPDSVAISHADNAIPQYYVGHLNRVAKIKEECSRTYPHLALLGTAFHGVAVNDCIASAKAFASFH